MDGRHSFPDTDHRAREHGDELARAGVQHEASDQHRRRANSDSGDPGLRAFARPDRAAVLLRKCRTDYELVNSINYAFAHSLGQERT